MKRKRFFCLLFLSLSFSVSLQAKPGKEYRASDLLKGMQAGDKLAILMVHFGSAYPEARTRVLDVMNQEVQKTFGSIEFREAYSARSIVNRLKKEGIRKYTPGEAMVQLEKEGYTHVIVQSTSLIEGVEMEGLRREMEPFENHFKDVRVGNPLLYDESDYRVVADVLANSPAAQKKGAKLLAAHGTYHASNSAYAMLGYLFQTEGMKDFFTGTREGFPTLETVITQLRKGKYKKVTLVPCMFVLINEEQNEVSRYWKNELEKKGFQCGIYPKGLGEYPEIRSLIIQHIHFSFRYKRISVLEKKKLYAQ